jgi:hypothetical protein
VSHKGDLRDRENENCPPGCFAAGTTRILSSLTFMHSLKYSSTFLALFSSAPLRFIAFRTLQKLRKIKGTRNGIEVLIFEIEKAG